MKIKGIKKAVGDYQRANKNANKGCYGLLMYDTSDGEIWTDYFCSIGHNEWKEYHSSTIINLGAMLAEHDIPVTMANVKICIRKFLTEGEKMEKRNENMWVCEHCLYAIEAHEGKQVTIRHEVDEENEQESKCDFCEESGFNELYELI